MAKTKTIYLIKDGSSVLSAAASLTVAKRQLDVLCTHQCWNYRCKVLEVQNKGKRIVFENHEKIEIVETELIGSRKLFMKHFGFLEKYEDYNKQAFQL